MSYRWVDHTAEVELHVDAPTPELVLQCTMRALAELLGEGTGPPEIREIRLEAPDAAALLVAWLEELVFLAETEGFIADAAELVHWSTNRVEARVRGRIGEPRPLVKAVTYHGLEFEAAGNGWRAKVVLDV